MYRIFGLPVPPAGTPAPHYDATTILLLPEDRGKRAGCTRRSTCREYADRFSVQRPDGSVRQVRSRWRVIHDDEGRPARIVGVDIDETDEVGSRGAPTSCARTWTWRCGWATRRRLAARSGERRDLARRARLPADWPRAAAAGRAAGRGAGGDPSARRRQGPRLGRADLRTGEPSDVAIPTPGLAAAGGTCCRGALLRAIPQARRWPSSACCSTRPSVSRRRRPCGFARRLEAAAEAARIGLWSASEGDALPTWNRRTFELFGLDPAGPALLLADWLRRCVHPDDRDRVGARCCAGHAAAPARSTSAAASRPVDGSVRWLVMRGGVSTGDASGEPRRFEGVVIDVTEQEQTRQRLRDAAERVEPFPRRSAWLWECDPGGANADWDANMFRLRGVDSPGRGVTAEEIASYVHPQDRDAVIASAPGWAAASPGAEIRRLLPDGSVHWLASWSSPVLDSAPAGR